MKNKKNNPKKENKFNLKKEYQDSLSYIKTSSKFIWLIAGIFLFSFFIGLLIAPSELVSEKILEFIKNIIEKTKEMNHSELISFILANNLKSSFIGMIFGTILGIFPIFSAIANGYIVGFVSNMVINSENIFFLWRLLPHGIFEIPALFISLGIGTRLGISFFNTKKLGKFKENLISCFKTFILIVIPLLIIAAIIEGTLIFLKI